MSGGVLSAAQRLVSGGLAAATLVTGGYFLSSVVSGAWLAGWRRRRARGGGGGEGREGEGRGAIGAMGGARERDGGKNGEKRVRGLCLT